MRFPTVLFDLDGTVVDSGAIILASMRHEACLGMEDALVRLHEVGVRLGIVTAKRRSTVELAFDRVPLRHLFQTIVGGDETERHKPDPEPLLLGAERMNAEPDRTAYVGDSPFR